MCENLLNGENVEEARLLRAYRAGRADGRSRQPRRGGAGRAGGAKSCPLPENTGTQQSARLARQDGWHDEKPDPGGRPVAVAQIPGDGACIATSKLIGAIRNAVADVGGAARRALGAGLVRRHAGAWQRLPRGRPRAGADRADPW